MSEKDAFAMWFETNNFGGDMWKDFRNCHKQIELLREENKVAIKQDFPEISKMMDEMLKQEKDGE